MTGLHTCDNCDHAYTAHGKDGCQRDDCNCPHWKKTWPQKSS